MTALNDVLNPTFSLYADMLKALEDHGYRIGRRSSPQASVRFFFTVLSYRSPAGALNVEFSPNRETGGVDVEMKTQLHGIRHQETMAPEANIEGTVSRLEQIINKHIT